MIYHKILLNNSVSQSGLPTLPRSQDLARSCGGTKKRPLAVARAAVRGYTRCGTLPAVYKVPLPPCQGKTTWFGKYNILDLEGFLANA